MIGKMYWRTALGCWYCKVSGRQTRLSPGLEDARMLYSQLLVEHGTVTVPTVRDLVAIYLGRKRLEASTLAKKKAILTTLVALHGDMKAADIEVRHIEQWVEY